MNASGIWRGRSHGRTGHFKFINVEVLPENRSRIVKSANRISKNTGPSSVEDLLLRIGLKEYTSVFVLNGWVDQTKNKTFVVFFGMGFEHFDDF